MKKTLLTASAATLLAAQGFAVEVDLYGQVNKMLLGYDDGQTTDVVVADNDLSSTRFGLKGKQKLDNGLTASVLFEAEMQSNPSDTFSQNFATPQTQSLTPASTTPVNFAERQANVGLSGDFGGVYLGQLSTAIDGVLTQDLTGVKDVMGANYRKIGGGLNFRTTAGANSGITVRSMAETFDAVRADAIRYDSPIFNGFQGKLAVAQGGDLDGSVNYNGTAGDFKLKGAAGVHFNNDNTSVAANAISARYQASVSAKHTSGVAGTLAYSTASLQNKAIGANDPTNWYAKVGYAWDAYEVAADYGRASHFRSVAAGDDTLTSYGLGGQWNLTDGVSAAAFFRNYDAEITGTATDSINLYGVNMRVKF
ncbi:MAG: porin [Pseudomonadaceae bacterium]|nr:porin [Pseudomonadaceae bacterium]